MILGITGGTGCGKTTLLNCIRDRGGLVLDCDAIYHDLLKTDRALLLSIDSAFPGVVKKGILDRKALGSRVFADPQALERLNAITHRAVYDQVRQMLGENRGLAAIDAIALFESGLSELCTCTVAVTAPREARVARLMVRDRISEAYAGSRIDAQHPDSWFADRCDHLLRNEGSREEFHIKCLAFLDRLGIMKEKRKGDDSK